MIKNFNVISSDVGKINDQYFINVAAAGMFSDISFVVSKEEKKKFGPLAYYFKGMTQLPQQLSTNLHLNVTVDNESLKKMLICLQLQTLIVLVVSMVLFLCRYQ